MYIVYLARSLGGHASRVASAAAQGPDIGSMSPQFSWPSPYYHKMAATAPGITLTNNSEEISLSLFFFKDLFIIYLF